MLQVPLLVSFTTWCLPTMVLHNINTSAVLWEDARDVLPHWWPWLSKIWKTPWAGESRNQKDRRCSKMYHGCYSPLHQSFLTGWQTPSLQLASSAPARSEVEYDVLQAEKARKKTKLHSFTKGLWMVLPRNYSLIQLKGLSQKRWMLQTKQSSSLPHMERYI